MEQIKSNKINRRKRIDGIRRREEPVAISNIYYSPKRINKYARYSWLKVTMIGSWAVILSLGLSTVGSTVSYFNDTETTEQNRLQAGSLGLNISSFNDVAGRSLARLSSSDAPEGLQDSDEENIGNEEFDVIVDLNQSTVPVIYDVSVELDKDNPLGCEELNLEANLDSFNYNGLANKFISPPTSEMGSWHFNVSLPLFTTGLQPSALCKGAIVFKAGLGGVSDDLIHTFTDEKRYSFVVKNWENDIRLPEEEKNETPKEEPKESLVDELPTEPEVQSATTDEPKEVVDQTEEVTESQGPTKDEETKSPDVQTLVPENSVVETVPPAEEASSSSTE